MTDLAYGIDFGTTNSAVARVHGGRPMVIPMDAGSSGMLRSVMFFPVGSLDVFFGDEAISRYLEMDMRGRFLQSVKTVLAADFGTTKIRGQDYDVEDLVELILTELKSRADRAVGADVTRVVLGCPVKFSDDRRKDATARKRLIAAAELAGFTDIRLQLEPVAAALSYELTLNREELVLVTDLGGGTTDFTLMALGPKRLAQADRRTDVIATGGIPIAGDALDKDLMWGKIIQHFGYGVRYETWPGKWMPIPANLLVDLSLKGRFLHLYNQANIEMLEMIRDNADNPVPICRLLNLIQENLGYSLHKTVEAVKCELTAADSTRLIFNKLDLPLNIPITRAEFNALINPSVDKISKCVDALLKDAAIKPDNIDAVYMTGGTSLVPRLRQLFGQKFGGEKIRHSASTFLSVVEGLALSTRLNF